MSPRLIFSNYPVWCNRQGWGSRVPGNVLSFTKSIDMMPVSYYPNQSPLYSLTPMDAQLSSIQESLINENCHLYSGGIFTFYSTSPFSKAELHFAFAKAGHALAQYTKVLNFGAHCLTLLHCIVGIQSTDSRGF